MTLIRQAVQTEHGYWAKPFGPRAFFIHVAPMDDEALEASLSDLIPDEQRKDWSVDLLTGYTDEYDSDVWVLLKRA